MLKGVFFLWRELMRCLISEVYKNQERRLVISVIKILEVRHMDSAPSSILFFELKHSLLSGHLECMSSQKFKHEMSD